MFKYFCKHVQKTNSVQRLRCSFSQWQNLLRVQLILGNVEELLKKLDTFRFTYQQVDCLYTLFKYRFSGKNIAKSGQVFENLQRALDFNRRKKGVDRMPSIAKKRHLRKKFKKQLFSSLQQTKTTPTSGSAFAERIEKVEKTKFELGLIKFVDCFLDCHGNYDSNLVPFKSKSFLTVFWLPKKFVYFNCYCKWYSHHTHPAIAIAIPAIASASRLIDLSESAFLSLRRLFNHWHCCHVLRLSELLGQGVVLSWTSCDKFRDSILWGVMSCHHMRSVCSPVIVRF